MALSHAILVSLLDRPQSGYDLAKRFDQTVGYFWKARHQQIYLELHKLAKLGWVHSETVPQRARPNRIVYAITPHGQRALDEWLRLPTEPPNIKEELLIKLFALKPANLPLLLEETRRRLRAHRQRLAQYQQLMQQHYAQPAQLSLRRRGHYLGLRMGILIEQATLQWCEEALQLLMPADPSQSA